MRPLSHPPIGLSKQARELLNSLAWEVIMRTFNNQAWEVAAQILQMVVAGGAGGGGRGGSGGGPGGHQCRFREDMLPFRGAGLF